MDMVTRVAMAIASSQLDEGDSLYDWYALTEEVQDDFLATARAAIEAMREPTEAMRIAGHQHIPDDHGDPWASAIEVWQAMISAALSQTIGEK